MFLQLLGPVIVAVGVQAGSIPPLPVTSFCSTSPEPLADALVEDRWITSLPVAVAASPQQLRGRRLSLRDVRVQQVDSRGFWIGSDPERCHLYVKPAEGGLIRVTPGELIDLQGEFRFRRARPVIAESEPVAYVYAYIVRRAPDHAP